MDSRTKESPAGGNSSALSSEAATAGFEQSMLGSGLPTSLEAVQVNAFNPSFSFQPATPAVLGGLGDLDNITFVAEDRSPSPAPSAFEYGGNQRSTTPFGAPQGTLPFFDIGHDAPGSGGPPSEGSYAGSTDSYNGGHAAGLLASLAAQPATHGNAQFALGTDGAAETTLRASPQTLDFDLATSSSPMLSSSPGSSLPFALPAMPEPTPGIGPIRTRRGQHAKEMSIDAIPGLSFDFVREESSDEYKENSSVPNSDLPARTIKMGEHSFTIPLVSPTVAPQLQSNIRVTSTGKPSHAKKVPEGHVKRPRNAFILFRSYACTNNLLPKSLGIIDHRQVSRVVGQLWKGLKPEEKAVWERKALEEKEEHKRNNPNYRYRPVFSKAREAAAAASKKRRRKPAEDEELAEEDRKSEVVARVLLEGRDLTNEQIEEEVHQQKIQDEIEGRDRSASRARSRSRSKSVNSRNAESASGRPEYQDIVDENGMLAVAGPYSHSRGHSRSGSDPDDMMDLYHPEQHDGGPPSRRRAATRSKRSKTLATSVPSDYALPSMGMPGSALNAMYAHDPYAQGSSLPSDFMAPARFSTMPPSLIAPSPRTATGSGMSALFGSLDHSGFNQPTGYSGGDQMAPTPFTGFFKGGGLNDNLSLVSPSFSRKFSLGRWEVPHTHAAQVPPSALFDHHQQHQPHAHTPGMFAGSSYPNTLDGHAASSGSSNGSQHPYQSYGYEPAEQPFDAAQGQTQGQGQAPGQPAPGPTYVYLSKEDAQNPEIVNHYLAQGFGVSYDA